MTAQKTRCPFCESTFAVTPEQLSARGGHVRCGRCFQVFKADDQLVSDDAPSSSTTSPVSQHQQNISSVFDLLDAAPAPHAEITLAGQQPASSTAMLAPSKQLAALDQPKSLEDDFDSLFDKLSPIEVDPSKGYAHDSQVSMQAVPSAIPAASQQSHTPHPTQLSAIKPLFQESPKAISKPSMAATMLDNDHKPKLVLDDELSDLFLGDRSQKMDALKADELSIAAVDKLKAGADESWAEALLAEEDQKGKRQEIVPPPPPAAKAKATYAKPTAVKLPETEVNELPVGESFIDSTSRQKLRQDDDLLSFLNQAGAASNPDLAIASLPESRPLANSTRSTGLPPPASHRIKMPKREPVRWLPMLGWGGLSLVMLVMLIAQYFYFNFERLSTDPQHYDSMKRLCSVAGCHVPLIDINQIAIKKVTAKRHPAQSSLTRFTFTLVNQAAETQPMPALKLVLKKDGQVIAGRVIQPVEYLYGPAQGLTRLAPQSPLRLMVDVRAKRQSFDSFSLDPIY